MENDRPTAKSLYSCITSDCLSDCFCLTVGLVDGSVGDALSHGCVEEVDVTDQKQVGQLLSVRISGFFLIFFFMDKTEEYFGLFVVVTSSHAFVCYDETRKTPSALTAIT